MKLEWSSLTVVVIIICVYIDLSYSKSFLRLQVPHLDASQPQAKSSDTTSVPLNSNMLFAALCFNCPELPPPHLSPTHFRPLVIHDQAQKVV